MRLFDGYLYTPREKDPITSTPKLHIRHSSSPLASSVHKYVDVGSTHPMVFSPPKKASPLRQREGGTTSILRKVPSEVELQILEGDDNYSPRERQQTSSVFPYPYEDASPPPTKKNIGPFSNLSPVPHQPLSARHKLGQGSTADVFVPSSSDLNHPKLHRYYTVGGVSSVSPSRNQKGSLPSYITITHEKDISPSQDNSDLHRHHQFTSKKTSLESASVRSSDKELECYELQQLVDQLQMALTTERSLSENLQLKIDVLEAEASARVAAQVAMERARMLEKEATIRSQPTTNSFLESRDLEEKDRLLRQQEDMIEQLTLERDALMQSNASLKVQLAAAETASAKNFRSGSQWREGHDVLLQELANLKVELAEYQSAFDRIGIKLPLEGPMIQSAMLRAQSVQTVSEVTN